MTIKLPQVPTPENFSSTGQYIEALDAWLKACQILVNANMAAMEAHWLEQRAQREKASEPGWVPAIDEQIRARMEPLAPENKVKAYAREFMILFMENQKLRTLLLALKR